MPNSPEAPRASWRLPLLGLAAVGLFVAFRLLPVAAWLRSLQATIQGLGLLGAVVFVAIYVLATVLFVPGSALTLAAGALYGPWVGTALVSLASTLGAAAAFLVGRYLARSSVERWCSSNPKLAALDSAVSESGWRIVLLTRLSPVFPFNLLNYAFGLTRIGFSPYLAASWIGMLPGTALYVGGGAAGVDVATGGGRGRGFYLALAGTVAVTVYVTRLAKAALARQPPTKE